MPSKKWPKAKDKKKNLSLQLAWTWKFEEEKKTKKKDKKEDFIMKKLSFSPYTGLSPYTG